MKINFATGKLIRFKLVFISLSLIFPSLLFSQTVDTTVVARLMLVQKPMAKSGKPTAAISVTFRNTSDNDLYIPFIFSRERTFPMNSRVNTFIKVNGKFIRDSSYGNIPSTKPRKNGVFSNPISDTPNDIVKANLSVATDKEKVQRTILDDFRKQDPDYNKNIDTDFLKPLFLKAHEEYEIYLIGDCDQLIAIPNEYMVTYQFNYDFKKGSDYPEKILTYKKFLPIAVSANVLYIKVEK